jgi:MFS family permease
MMAVVGSRFAGSELVGIYAVIGLVWGLGALVGPALAGLAMDLSAHGLPIFAALACLAFTITPLPAAARPEHCKRSECAASVPSPGNRCLSRRLS